MVETSNEHRKRLEFQDYGHELAGLDTGRMSRFGIGAARAQEIKDKQRQDRAYRDALDRLLLDPEYRRLYEDLGKALGQAEAGADETIASLQAALSAQAETNQDMRDRAPKIDGKSVFRYADGRVVDEGGNEIDAAFAAGIIWPDDAPTAEAYFAGVEREAELRSALETWQTYRNDTLGGIRNRYEDRDNPMSKDEMRDDLEAIEADRPASFDLGAPSASGDIPTAEPVAALAKPSF